MTRKDFQLIADVLRAHQDGGDKDYIIRGLATCFAIELAKTNPRFNKELFIKACSPNEQDGMAKALSKYGRVTRRK